MKNFTFKNRIKILLSFVLSTLFLNVYGGEGSKQTTTSTSNRASLCINSDEYGNFARYGSTDVQRLYIRIQNPNSEKVYLGFSRARRSTPTGDEINSRFRIMKPDGTVAFSNYTLDSGSSNITGNESQRLSRAQSGPVGVDGVTSATGYTPIVFNPNGMPAGDYWIEFENPNNTGDQIFYNYYDITVANSSNNSILGRIYSKRWAFGMDNVNTDFNGAFYVFAPDNGSTTGAVTQNGFVNKINFNGAGFRPWYFNVAFNNTGPGNSGVTATDQKSVYNASDATKMSPKYEVFLNDPDINIWKNGTYNGNIQINGITNCGIGESNINISVFKSGTIEILLDFNGGDGVYTPGTKDVLTTQSVTASGAPPYAVSVPWNGKDGLGNTIAQGTTIPIVVSFGQAAFHFPMYDVEENQYGFSCTTVRPAAPAGYILKFYWDDSNITYTGGTFDAKLNLTGCTPNSTPPGGCHRWNGFDNGNNGSPQYGNLNTINTWWYANRDFVTSNIVLPPFYTVALGPTSNVKCNGGNDGKIQINVTNGTAPFLYYINGGTTANTLQNLTAGTYNIKVVDANGCSATINGVVITQPAAAVTITKTKTDVKCFGQLTGAIDLTVTGGTGTYTYSWKKDNNTIAATTQDLTGIGAGAYEVTVTDANGCSTIDTITIGQPAAAINIAETSRTDVKCFGQLTGAIDLTVTGGTGTYTYSWKKDNNAIAATTQDLTGIGAGTYEVTVTDANGCTAVKTITVGQPAAAINIAETSRTDVKCFGQLTGAIDLTVTGGTGTYTYSWKKDNNAIAATTQDLTGIGAGTYEVTVTDANGCTAVKTITVGQPAAAINIAETSRTDVKCFGQLTGAIDLTVTGGTGTYTYSWKKDNNAIAATTQDLTGIGAGTYEVTVTDANGCTAVKTITVGQPAAAINIAETSRTDVKCFGQLTGAIDLTVTGGTGTYTYSWKKDNNAIAATTQDLTGIGAGTYEVTVTDANGCTAVKTITVGQPAAAINIAETSRTDVKCFGQLTGAIDLTVTGGTGTYTYSWKKDNNAIAATTQDLTGIGAGTYEVTVTDANGCTAVKTITVGQPAAAINIAETSRTDVKCFGQLTGAIDLTVTGGTGTYTYSWKKDNNAIAATTQDLTGIGAGTYEVTVTDANGCTAVKTITVGQPAAAINIAETSRTDVKCFGQLTGAIDLTVTGGTGTYTYSWKKDNNAIAATTQDLTGIGAGTYEVTVTDANGCTAVKTITVGQPAAAINIAETSRTDVKCFGQLTGAIDLTVTGGTGTYTYSWKKDNNAIAATTQDLTGIGAGTYEVTVTDANGCTAVKTITVGQPAAAINIAETSRTDVKCFGQLTGAIDLTVTGGTGTYTYSWKKDNNAIAATTQDLTGIGAGTYEVTVTDANGCTAVKTITVGQPAAAINIAETSRTDVKCFGQLTGAIDLTVTGGTGTYTYSWKKDNNAIAATTQDLTGIGAGTYEVTVTDANGCTAVKTITVGQPAAAINIAETSRTDVKCFGQLTGAIDLTVTGGTGTYTYSWKKDNNAIAATTQDLTGIGAGTYEVTVTDANGCTAVKTITVGQPAQALSCSVVQNKPVTANGLSNGEATVSALGGTPGYTYLWSNGETTQKAIALNAGMHSVKVTDINGCFTECTVEITQPNVLSCSIQQDATVKCYGGNTGKATVTAVGGNGEYTYKWDNDETTATAVALTAGLHTVTVTDKLNYTTKCEITIGQPQDPLSATTTQVDVACGGGTTGSATVIPAGGTSPYAYSWDTTPVQTGATATGLKAGTYIVTVKDANLCTVTKTVTIIDGDSVKPVINPLPETSTINCPATPVFTQATATDNSGNAPVLTYEDVTTPGNCAGSYSITRTWTAKDECGNISLPVSQTIKVQDKTKPTWVTQTASLNRTIECSDTQALTAAQALFPTATDTCDQDVSNINKVKGEFKAVEGCKNAGTYTNTWTVTDDCGNISETFTQVITIQDTTAPTWSTEAASLNKTIECSDTQALATAQALFPTATDACDTNVTNILKASGQFKAVEGCKNAGTYTNTWTVTDDCGNISETFTQIITIQDTTAPTWSTEAASLNRTIECSDKEALASAQALFPAATDACDTDVSNIDKVSGEFKASEECGNAGTYTNTWTVKDDCGNTSETFTQIITIQDTTKPTFVGNLPSDITVSCDAVPEPFNMEASDNCNGDLPIVFKEVKSDVKNECGTEYTLTRTWTTSDCGGNSISYAQVITVRDTTPPTGTAPSNVANLQSAADIPAGSPSDIKDAADNCAGAVKITVSDTNNGGTGCNGESYILTRTYTLTDCAGNKTELVQTFTVENKVSVSGIATNVSCQGKSDGSIAVTSSPGSTVVITNQNNEVVGNTNLPAGTYTLTATSVVNSENETCTATATVVITEPNYKVKISGQIINVDTNTPIANVPVTLIPQGTTTGPILLRVTGADGMYSFTGMPAGSYLVQVQDANLNSAYQLYPVDSSLFFTTLKECEFQVHNFEYGKSNLPVLGDYVWYDTNGNGVQDEWYDANNDGVVTKNIPDAEGAVDYSLWEWIDFNGDGSYVGPSNAGELNAGGFGNASNPNIIIDGPNGYHSEVIIGIQGFWRDRPEQANPYGEYNIKLVREANLDAVAAALGETGLVKVLPSSTDRKVTSKPAKLQMHTVCQTTSQSGIIVNVTPEDLVHLDADFGVNCKEFKDIVANDDSAGPIAGVNHITKNVLNVLPNDTLEGVVVTASDVVITTVTPNEFLQLNSDGSVDVLPNAPVGTLTMVYQICEADATSNCDTATVTVMIVAPVITVTASSICINDVPYLDYTVTPVNFTPANGVSITWADAANKVVTTMSDLPLSGRVLWPGATVDTNGKGTDWPGWVFQNNQWIQAPDGFEGLRPTANITLSLNPSETITVNYPPSEPFCTARPTFAIVANDDNAGPISGGTGATNVVNVYTNDTLNGNAINPADVTLTTVTPDPTGALILNPNGSVDVKVGTTGGTYTLTYQICENADAGNCDTAIVTITVVDPAPPTPINAVDDTYSNIGCNTFGLVGNVLSNDTKGLTRATLDLVEFTLLTETNSNVKTDSNITFDTLGNVRVSSLTPAGTYTYTYRLCDKLSPGNCDTATVTIIVLPNGVTNIASQACNDDSTLLNLSNLLPQGTATTGTWVDTNNTNALQGSTLNTLGLALGNYIFEYRIKDESCPRTIALNMEINDDCKVLPCGNIVVHNAFSPNGDGKNDVFVIDSIDDLTCYPGNTVEIYNRWGILVFETTNYNNETNAFDGTSRGRTTIKQSDGLPTGTYFYILNYKSLNGNNEVQDNKKDGYLYLSK